MKKIGLAFVGAMFFTAPLSLAQEDEQPQPEQISPSQLLSSGFSELESGKYAHARDDFAKAIATEELNDAGSAVAYWGILTAERQMGHVELTADAASNFVAVAGVVLRFRSEEQKTFIEQFGLRHKIAIARALLSAIWAQEMPDYGASPGYPVRIHDQEELMYFIKLIGTCDDGLSPTNKSKLLAAVGWRIEHIVVSCSGTSREFYFAYH